MARLSVAKTYKIYIGGKFPRTESGRYYQLKTAPSLPSGEAGGGLLANVCLCSRKDFRDAVVAARTAFAGWSSASAFNRSQVLYRIAEMLEGRREQFIEELKLQGSSQASAQKEVDLCVDRIVYYAGWCDKYQQMAGTVNPVSSSHFNFSVPEPTGVVALIAPEESGLIGLVSNLLPVIAGGNSAVALASESKPLCAVSFAEVLNSSDVPGGVVNILTGKSAELHGHSSSHKDVNALIYCRDNEEEIKAVQTNGAINVKRVFIRQQDWMKEDAENPYLILNTQEIKTTWHPIENIGPGGSGY